MHVPGELHGERCTRLAMSQGDTSYGSEKASKYSMSILLQRSLALAIVVAVAVAVAMHTLTHDVFVVTCQKGASLTLDRV